MSTQMTHTRIRPFNTKETYPEQNLDNDLCQAVVARGTMVSGCKTGLHRYPAELRVEARVPRFPLHGEVRSGERSGESAWRRRGRLPTCTAGMSPRELRVLPGLGRRKAWDVFDARESRRFGRGASRA